MKVRIKKAHYKTLWYAKLIGLEFEVTESKDFREHYELVLPGETLRSFILKENAIKV